MMEPLRSKDRVEHPFGSPHGETVYELIGRTVSSAVEANHSLAHIEITPGDSSRPHFHKICQETYYILSGSAVLQVDGEHKRLEPGESCRITPGQVHQITNPGKELLAFLAVCVPAWYAEDLVYV